MINTQDIRISCADGFQLAGTLYRPKRVRAAVMIAPATGIKRGFYHAFATCLAEMGYACISYDNRGIGDSLDGPVSQSDASLVDWGRLDMTAVLEQLKRSFPRTSYHLVGHSAGGQMVGLMKNAGELSSMFNVACSSGSLRNMPYPFWFSAMFFMNVFIPAGNLLFGHTKSQWVGMGEPLPKAVAAQWRKWCNGEGYIKVDLDTTIRDHLFDELRLPSRWLYATDDPIANEKNVREMIRVYSNITAEVIPLDPAKLGYEDIGHMKFFSSRREELWEYAVEWLDRWSGWS